MVAQYIPKNPDEKASVLAVLSEHPELQDFIARVSKKAREMFPEISITLDTVRYDDWDPPVRMLVHITQPWDDYKVASRKLASWAIRQPGFDWDLILVMPMWNGPIESYHR